MPMTELKIGELSEAVALRVGWTRHEKMIRHHGTGRVTPWISWTHPSDIGAVKRTLRGPPDFLSTSWAVGLMERPEWPRDEMESRGYWDLRHTSDAWQVVQMSTEPGYEHNYLAQEVIAEGKRPGIAVCRAFMLLPDHFFASSED